MSAVRQTRTHISELLARSGLHPRHRLGQNFLVDVNLIEFLVAQADLGPDDVVLEVGSGTGGLTAFLAGLAGAVISVEIDTRLQELAARSLADESHVRFVSGDVLSNKNRLSSDVVAAVDEELSLRPDRRLKLVANLPYCVATPVMSNLLALEYPLERMVVTIQLELAQRIAALPGTDDYSALSVWVQSQCRVELLRKLPPTVFWPQPKVDSAILRVTPAAELRSKIGDRAFLHDFLRIIFQKRRKMLRGVLAERFRGELSREQIDSVLTEERIESTARAEELSPSQLVSLSNQFWNRFHAKGEHSPPCKE